MFQKYLSGKFFENFQEKNRTFSDAYGCTPLHYAAIVGRDESMDPLLDLAQNESSQFMFSIIEKTDLRGRTIFHYACYTNADDIMVNLCQRLDKIRSDQANLKNLKLVLDSESAF